ncbi:MAG: spore coat associated protein CotJA [Clostridia bacterium]|nr:spore coat associated protein CotJA [Clostridia bacterium]
MKKTKKIENTKPCDNKYDDKCECGFENDPTVFPENYMYGQSYVPIQYINEIFKPEVGLKMGTIFPELVSPYMPGQSMEEDKYLRRMTGREGQCPLE